MEGMSKIVKTVTGLLSGAVFMYGLYIITHGHLTPGGGFAGGAVVAGSFILLILAYGSDVFMLRKEETESSITESSAIMIVLILVISNVPYFLKMRIAIASNIAVVARPITIAVKTIAWGNGSTNLAFSIPAVRIGASALSIYPIITRKRNILNSITDKPITIFIKFLLVITPYSPTRNNIKHRI